MKLSTNVIQNGAVIKLRSNGRNRRRYTGCCGKDLGGHLSSLVSSQLFGGRYIGKDR